VSSVSTTDQGQPVTFTVTVAGVAANSNVPQGTVTLVIDGVSTAPVLLVNGTATFTTTGLAPGTNSVQAEYEPTAIGDYSFGPGVSNVLVQNVISPLSPIGRRWNR
jgi:hypothetical protein